MYSLLFTGNVKITVATVIACILVFLIIVVIVIVYMTPNIELYRDCIVFTFIYRECEDYSGDSDSLYIGVPDHCGYCYSLYDPKHRVIKGLHCIHFYFQGMSRLQW